MDEASAATASSDDRTQLLGALRDLSATLLLLGVVAAIVMGASAGEESRSWPTPAAGR